MEELRKKLSALDKKSLFGKFLLFSVVLVLIAVTAQCAFAMTAPADGSKFKAISDLIVKDVVNGPIGYALCVVSGVFTAGMMVMSRIGPAVGGLIGTALMATAPSIVTSMGAMII